MKDNTLNYYNNNSKEYFESTRIADMTHLYKEFLDYIPKYGKILDLGCGSGRDSLYFINNNYVVTAVDGSCELAKEAEKLINQQVIVSTFQDLILDDKYDGIWASASLLHVKRESIKDVLMKLANNLECHSVFYMSFKYGDNEYIDEKGRYFNCYTEESFNELIQNTGKYKIINMYKSGDTLGGRDDLLWLNILLYKRDAKGLKVNIIA